MGTGCKLGSALLGVVSPLLPCTALHCPALPCHHLNSSPSLLFFLLFSPYLSLEGGREGGEQAHCSTSSF